MVLFSTAVIPELYKIQSRANVLDAQFPSSAHIQEKKREKKGKKSFIHVSIGSAVFVGSKKLMFTRKCDTENDYEK